MFSMLSSGQSTNVKANGNVLNSFRPISNNQPCRHHVRQANTGAVAAAAVCAQAASSTVAASGTDQLYSQDPALDTLIDRWLSHKHASTSAPASNGNGQSRGGGSRRQQRQADQQVQADWEALLGPVSATLTALATLEEGDEVFALNDSLSHLGGSLQELQQLATQLLYQTQQQQQQDASIPTAAAASYTEQLAQLLHTAAQQVEALDDTGLINLLAIATVLLTAINSTNITSSSATTTTTTNSSSSSSSASGYPAVHAAATAAVEATCAELWQRPRAAAGLDAAQLTSLAVVLRRLNKLGVDSSVLPLSLHLSAYRQLQELAESGQMSASQLAVCCWCLSSLPVAPPAAAVAAGLRAAAAATATTATGEGGGDSSSALDGLSIRRLSAACINWQPYLTQQLAAAEGATDIAAAAREFVQGAAQLWRLQLDKAGSFTTTNSSSAAGSSSSSSSSSSDSIWKVALSVAQSAAAYSVFPTEGLVEGVASKLVEQAGLSEAESTTSFRELQDAAAAAAAAGHLLPWWAGLDASLQQQLPQAIFQQQGQQQQQLLQSFLAGVEHSCCWSVGQLSTDGQQHVYEQLEAIAQLLLGITQDSSDRIAGSNSALSHSLQLLLRSMVAASYTSKQLVPLCAAASQLLQANSAAAADTQGPAAAPTAAVVSAAIALCRLKPPGWRDQLQQLQTVLLEAGGSKLQQLQVKDAIELHAAAAGAAAEDAAASSLAAASLQHLLMPTTLGSAQPQQAAELLVLLTVGPPPWNMAAGQQLQTAPPAGLQQLMCSRSADGPDAAVMLQQQCLRCMSIIVQDSGRSLLPGQLVPVLAAQLFLSQQQQQQQQQQWLGPMSQPMLQSYQQLHRETLAAVALHLQDCASLLAPGELAWSARLLALLQSRPSLTLAAVIRAAAQSVGQFRRQELKWLLWGLTKLQFTGLRWQQQQLLSAALSSTAAAAAAGGLAVEVEAQAAATPEGEQVTAAAAAAGVAATADSNSSTAAELDSDIALLWVAASRGSKDPAVLQLLSGVTAHAYTPPTAQVASVVWSFTRLAQMGVQQQQQLAALHPQVVQLAERALCSSNAELELQPRQIAVLTWGLHRLGHKPSSSAQAALVAAALRQIQLAQPATNTAGTAAVFLPGELSCFLHCLASWGVQLEQQQLEELETYLQQQLSQGLAAIRQAAAAGRAGTPGASKSSKILWWDGPAICGACWSLARMGATLQPSTLEAAEQHLLQVMPEAPAAPVEAPALQDSTEPGTTHAGQDRSRHTAGALCVAPPAATDLVLFGVACKGSDYQPMQLLQRFRGWLLMQLARKGAAGLMTLRSRGTKPQHSSTAALLPPSSPVSDPLQQQQQQRVRPSTPQHAHILVSVLLFLRQTGYAEPLLLQQLESLSAQRPVRVQLDARQVAILLSSFRQLGYVPEQWLNKAGIRLITRHIFSSGTTAGPNSNRTSAGDASTSGSLQSPYTTKGLSAQDCVDLLECLAAWHKHPSLSSNTSLQQYVLPGLAQLLLGVQHQQQGATTAAAVQRPAAGEAVSSSTNGRPAGTADPAAGNAPPSTLLKGNNPAGSVTGVSLIPVLQGWQVVSVLRSMVELDPPRFGKLSLLLQQQLLRRMQQTWPQFTTFNQVSAVQAAGRLGYDLSRLLNVQDLVPQAQQGPTEQQQAAAASQAWPFASASAASRLLWVFGNVGRHPGPQILPAALSAVEAAARAAAQAGQLLPLREVSTSLYAAAVLQELENPAARSLLQLLQDAAAAGELLTHPQFTQQSEQLAACLIAAQDATQAGSLRAGAGAGAAAAVAAAIAGDSSQSAATAGTQGPTPVSSGGSSPWLALPSAVQQRLMEAWRRKAMRKAGQQQGMGEHMQLLLSLRQLGLRGRAKVLTDDGCACIDVAVTTPRGDKLAVELLGPHNAAINTQRPLAPARLKWRVLSSRGYKVVVVNMWEWRSLDSGGLSSKSFRDGGSTGSSGSGSAPESSLEEYDGSVMSEKLLYLQTRVQNALGPAAAGAWAVGARRVRPLPQQVVFSRGGGVMPPAEPQRLFPRALRDDRG